MVRIDKELLDVMSPKLSTLLRAQVSPYLDLVAKSRAIARAAETHASRLAILEKSRADMTATRGELERCKQVKQRDKLSARYNRQVNKEDKDALMVEKSSATLRKLRAAMNKEKKRHEALLKWLNSESKDESSATGVVETSKDQDTVREEVQCKLLTLRQKRKLGDCPFQDILFNRDTLGVVLSYLATRSAIDGLGAVDKAFRQGVEDNLTRVALRSLQSVSLNLYQRFPSLQELEMHIRHFHVGDDLAAILGNNTSTLVRVLRVKDPYCSSILLRDILRLDWPRLKYLEVTALPDVEMDGFEAVEVISAPPSSLRRIAKAVRDGYLPRLRRVVLIGMSDSVGCGLLRLFRNDDVNNLVTVMAKARDTADLSVSINEKALARDLLQAVRGPTAAFARLRSLYLSYASEVAPGEMLILLGSGILPQLEHFHLDIVGTMTIDNVNMAPASLPRLRFLSFPATKFSVQSAVSILGAPGKRLQRLELRGYSEHHVPGMFGKLLSKIGEGDAPFAWRSNVTQIVFPTLQCSCTPSRTLTLAMRAAMLQLPSLELLCSMTVSEGIIFGLLEARVAGGLTRLKVVDFKGAPSTTSDIALVLLVMWQKLDHGLATFKVDVKKLRSSTRALNDLITDAGTLLAPV